MISSPVRSTLFLLLLTSFLLIKVTSLLRSLSRNSSSSRKEEAIGRGLKISSHPRPKLPALLRRST
ncbi:hypothetical protein BT69DRAFT_1287615 [Atractiella rhizophila]|nr:hypothetical protein BT69DRAFT_1287615 [Atractiella rhizophila]